MNPPPENLTEIIFRALYPEYDLGKVGSTYLVYPPLVFVGPLMYVSDSLGAIARQIAELENTDVELADLIADETGPLPQRPK